MPAGYRIFRCSAYGSRLAARRGLPGSRRVGAEEVESPDWLTTPADFTTLWMPEVHHRLPAREVGAPAGPRVQERAVEGGSLRAVRRRQLSADRRRLGGARHAPPRDRFLGLQRSTPAVGQS